MRDASGVTTIDVRGGGPSTTLKRLFSVRKHSIRRAPASEEREEKKTDIDKSQQMKLMMFMERSRKDYLETEEQSDRVQNVEKMVTHMHQTIVGMLEDKFEARLRSIESKMDQQFEQVKSMKSEKPIQQGHTTSTLQPDGHAAGGNDAAGNLGAQNTPGPCYTHANWKREQSSAIALVQDGLLKWPTFVEGPRSALAVVKFGLEVQAKPLLIY